MKPRWIERDQVEEDRGRSEWVVLARDPNAVSPVVVELALEGLDDVDVPCGAQERACVRSMLRSPFLSQNEKCLNGLGAEVPTALSQPLELRDRRAGLDKG